MTPASSGQVVHGGCVALWLPRSGWRGVLIQGPSGSGKSDLALRLIEAGWALVSDDRTTLWRSGGQLYGACPPAIAGLIEARGVGILPQGALAMAAIVLIAQCTDQPVERLPEPCTTSVAGGDLPALAVNSFQASAPAKLRRAILSLGHGAQGAYLPPAGNPRGGVPVKGRV
jgi:hypothetical protein